MADAIVSLRARLGSAGVELPAAGPDDRSLARLIVAAAASDLVVDRTTLALAVRALAARLELIRPGRTVELRIPPFAAVQLASDADTGATHTRGTPPNVVETDPLTFVRLAAGDVTWDDARAGHLVSASGIHADLSSLFPM